jgi:hypothetical protein
MLKSLKRGLPKKPGKENSSKNASSTCTNLAELRGVNLNLLTLYRISHEIRNPLSAVLHCAENIMDAVKGGEAKSDSIAVDEIVDAVHTIQLCVDHQVSRVTNYPPLFANHVAENSCR